MTPICLLHPAQYPLASPLFGELDDHLAVPAILRGDAPGSVYVDHPTAPRAGLILYQHRLYLAGDPANTDFNLGLNELIAARFPPAEEDVYFVVYPGAGWHSALETQVLNHFRPKVYDREYYTLNGPLPGDHPPLPPGFTLLPVDASLLERADLSGMSALLEELCSERDSVPAFLEKSFGTVMITPADLVSWCLSEYNCGSRCEVGIATLQKFQRRGLGTITGRAFVRQAFSHGIQQIGWHCWQGNLPSGALAKKIGFRLEMTYPAWVGCIQKVDE